jgi:UrcA family protein
MRNLFKSFALAVAGAISLSSAALAGEVRVPYGDLDLSRPAGAAEFQSRVDRAARDYCEANPLEGRGPVAGSPESCRRLIRSEIRSAMPSEQREALTVARARPAPVELAEG